MQCVHVIKKPSSLTFLKIFVFREDLFLFFHLIMMQIFTFFVCLFFSVFICLSTHSCIALSQPLPACLPSPWTSGDDPWKRLVGVVGGGECFSAIFPRTASCAGNDGLLLAPITGPSGAILIPVSKLCPPTPSRVLLRACRLGGGASTDVRARRGKQRLQSETYWPRQSTILSSGH